jgi:gamma-glutamylcyclotransferase
MTVHGIEMFHGTRRLNMAGVSEKKAFSGFSELVLQDGAANELYHFAYGSNMNHEQVLARGAKPKVVAAAKLPDHRLGFFGYSAVWDGAEESVIPAPGQDVWGVIYELTPSDKEKLDDWQDALFDGSGAYFHSPAKVTDQAGKVYSVLLYKKANLGTPQKPSQEYLNFIVQGAVEQGLPSAYVDRLRATESQKAKFVVPRQRKSAREAVPGGECSSCGDDLGTVISINLDPR